MLKEERRAEGKGEKKMRGKGKEARREEGEAILHHIYVVLLDILITDAGYLLVPQATLAGLPGGGCVRGGCAEIVFCT